MCKKLQQLYHVQGNVFLRYEYVRATPEWAKRLEAELPLGKTLVTFQALSPVSDESASCSFTIHVRDTVPPRVYNCPNDFQVYLDEGQIKRQVHYKNMSKSIKHHNVHLILGFLGGAHLCRQCENHACYGFKDARSAPQ